MTTRRVTDALTLGVGETGERADARVASRRSGGWIAFLALWDVLATFAVLSLAGRLAVAPLFDGRLGSDSRLSGPQLLAVALIAPPLLAAACAYGRRRLGLARLIGLGLLGSWTAVIVAAVTEAPLNLVQFALAAVALPVAWALGRAIGSRLLAPERVLILGSGRVTDRIQSLCERHPERGFEVVGFLDEDPFEVDGGGTECLGTVDQLHTVIDQHRIDRIIVTWSMASDERIMDLLRRCDHQDVEIDTVPRLFELLGGAPRVSSLSGLPLLGVPSSRGTGLRRAIKRAVDIIGSAGLLLVLAPVAAGVSLAILALDGRPVLFRQERVGRDGRGFRIVKFRTMRTDAESAGAPRIHALQKGALSIEAAVHYIKSETADRVTRIGRFLRVSSLDELPQLWNVLRGQMSLVGPRPLRDFEVQSLSDWELRRHDVRPGLTGLWQTEGRSDVSWAERMQMDYTYVRHWSLRWDLEILARTLPAVLSRRGSV